MSNSKSSKNYIYSGKIKDFKNALIEFFEELGTLKNQSPKISAINGYLAIHKSLTQRELKQLTGFSSGAISKYINILVNFGTVKRIKKEGSNEYIYYLIKPLSEMYRSTSEISMNLIEQIVSKIKKSIKKLENYKNDKGYGLFKPRLEELRKTFEGFAKIKELLFKK